MKAWLRKSADLVLVNLNARGDGSSYGRSTGPYGDTAFLEVLSAAAYFDVLTPVDKDMAYAFATRAVRKYVDFWVDPAMRSVNMWEKGRATDQYRNKTRILGENFSLSDQLVKTNDLWSRLGYKNRAPSPGFDACLATLPRTTLTWFTRGEHDRALLTYRDGSHVVSLPMVNGGPRYHNMNAYFPIPYSPRLVQGSPNARRSTSSAATHRSGIRGSRPTFATNSARAAFAASRRTERQPRSTSAESHSSLPHSPNSRGSRARASGLVLAR